MRLFHTANWILRSLPIVTVLVCCSLAIAADSPDAKPTADAKDDGFVSLFDGKSLTGWVGLKKEHYTVSDGLLICNTGHHDNLYTEKEYSDFDFRFDFKLSAGANNGIGIRAPREGDAAYVGMELQLLDDTADMYKGIKDYQHCSSVYGVVPAKTGHLKTLGEWNSEEVIAKGRHITITLNGATVVDADLDEASKNGTVDHHEHPGLKRESGHVGFLGHDSRVEFRNISIKDLTEPKKK